MIEAFISIGSNIGEREMYLEEAVKALRERKDTVVEKVSSIYETAPVGYTDQADFLNIVIAIQTTLSAGDLLKVCQGIEQELGRKRTIRWGPRTVDLDILLYNEEKIETETLIVPHPRMAERAFVLIPLVEIAPTKVNPLNGELYSQEEAVHEEGVKIWRQASSFN